MMLSQKLVFETILNNRQDAIDHLLKEKSSSKKFAYKSQILALTKTLEDLGYRFSEEELDEMAKWMEL